MKRNRSLSDSPPIFRNEFYDRLTRAKPIHLFIAYSPIIIGIAAYGVSLHGLSGFAIFFTGGGIFWSLFEYLLHRFLYHWEPSSGWIAKAIYTVHGIHHDHPEDRWRLVLPPAPGFAMGCLLLVISVFLMGDVSWAFMPGFFVGYLGYDTLHYLIHARSRPANPILAVLWVNHHAHHFADPSKNFGVSCPVWDRIFRTYRPRHRDEG